MDQLWKMLSQASSSSNMVQLGTALSAFGGLADNGEPWIIDSDALDHMTGCTSIFSSYVHSLGNHRVKIADGSYTAVVRTCTIRMSPDITLKIVLHVPNLSCNLLSISKITQDDKNEREFLKYFVTSIY